MGDSPLSLLGAAPGLHCVRLVAMPFKVWYGIAWHGMHGMAGPHAGQAWMTGQGLWPTGSPVATAGSALRDEWLCHLLCTVDHFVVKLF